MFKTIKHFVIPHIGNGFRPRLLEVGFFSLSVAIIVGLKCFSLLSFSNFIGADIFDQLSQSDLYTLTNQTRTENHLATLTVDRRLETAAQLKLADMVANHYFAHVSPAGVQPWAWFDTARYSYSAAGENLAMDFSSSNAVMQAWLNSPDHRRNILLPDFKNIGIAVGTAVIEGRPQTVVVQEFGALEAAAKPSQVAGKPAPAAKVVSKTTVVPSRSVTIFRTQASQPITFVGTIPIPVPHVEAAQTRSAGYLSLAGLNLIFILLALASMGVFLTNVLVARHIQFPALIVRSGILVGICLLALLVKDSTFFNAASHVIVP